jgi:hypothetical protein
MGTLIAMMLPYTITFAIMWTMMLLAWDASGLPSASATPVEVFSPSSSSISTRPRTAPPGITPPERPMTPPHAMHVEHSPNNALIGMVHVGALPGTPVNTTRRASIAAQAAAEEAAILADAGFDAIILENMHDAPYVHGDRTSAPRSSPR